MINENLNTGLLIGWRIQVGLASYLREVAQTLRLSVRLPSVLAVDPTQAWTHPFARVRQSRPSVPARTPAI